MHTAPPDALAHLAELQQEWRAFAAATPEQREAAGYGHTVREICQQPSTWIRTAELLAWSASVYTGASEQARSVLLTGSGSSQYAAECAVPVLAAELQIPVQTAGAGSILADPEQTLPSDPTLLVSVARSGDSPESAAAIQLALDLRPQMRHLVITCNRQGRIAREFNQDDRVRVITLDDRTCDRSLVMTSSFTNLALGARFLGQADHADTWKSTVAILSRAAGHLLETHTDAIAKMARSGFRRAVYLGTGTRFGAAREASLKMLEMTAGRVATVAETYLGLRHGPLSFIHDDTLVVCFLSSSAPARLYELDLIRELNAKHLGAAKLITGEKIAPELLGEHDYAVECPGLGDARDENTPVVHVIAGQLLALFRSLAEGLQPDAPSAGGVINRVVPGFQIHSSGAGAR